MREKYLIYVGKPLETLLEAARLDGKIVRVVKKDNAYIPVTRDYHVNRLNVAVRGNIVSEILGFS
jgi:hypothetical protein